MMQPIEEIHQSKRHKLNDDSVHSATTDSGNNQLAQLQVDGGASLEAMNVDQWSRVSLPSNVSDSKNTTDNNKTNTDQAASDSDDSSQNDTGSVQ
jgi:hypothetical protein